MPRICNSCVLPDTFPGIILGEDGSCQFCRKHASSGQSAADKERYRAKFQNLIEKVKQARVRRAIGVYDVLMAYSGGKDSTYTLQVLVNDFSLKVLAVTFNHGCVSPRAVENIEAVTGQLGVDHMMLTPSRKSLWPAFRRSVTEDVYPMKALERASAICNTCMNVAKSLFLRQAVQMEIPLMAYGWSPGQAPVSSSVMKMNPALMRRTQALSADSLGRLMGDEAGAFLLSERDFEHFEKLASRTDEIFFYNVHPLAFREYSEERIVEEIKKLGWVSPSDTDANSSNCLLNGFANSIHLQRYGFHPYAFEIAGLVREGCMTREAGLAKLAEMPNESIMRDVIDKLEIK